MDAPIQRDGMWWQQWEGRWLQWNPQSDGWEEQATAPPPPPAPPPVARQPVRAYAGSGASAAALEAGNTWSTVRITPSAAQVAYPAPTPATSGRSLPPLRVALIGLLAVAVALGAYVVFFRGAAGPSAEDIDGAFAPLDGYTYEELPTSISELITEQLEKNDDANDVIGEFDFRALARRGQTVGAVAVMGFDPDDFATMNKQQFAYGFEQGSGMAASGASLRTVERAGTTMYELTVPGAAVIIFFDESEGMVFSIATSDAASARKVSEQLAVSNL